MEPLINSATLRRAKAMLATWQLALAIGALLLAVLLWLRKASAGLHRTTTATARPRGGAAFNPDAETVRLYSESLGITPADAERMLSELASSQPSQIEERFLLGNASCAADRDELRAARVAYIVNASSDLPNHYVGDGIEYLRVPVEDSLEADLLSRLDRAVDFLARPLSDPYACGSVLVHCRQGVSRSATIVLAYLMRERGHSLRSALTHVQQRRFIKPNDAFLRQLTDYEAQVQKRSTLAGSRASSTARSTARVSRAAET